MLSLALCPFAANSYYAGARFRASTCCTHETDRSGQQSIIPTAASSSSRSFCCRCWRPPTIRRPRSRGSLGSAQICDAIGDTEKTSVLMLPGHNTPKITRRRFCGHIRVTHRYCSIAAALTRSELYLMLRRRLSSCPSCTIQEPSDLKWECNRRALIIRIGVWGI